MTQRAKKNKSQNDSTRSVALQSFGADFGLSGPVCARMLGVSQRDLVKWEAGNGEPKPAILEKAAQVKDLLVGLAKVMRRDFIPTWLQSPNDACAEAGVRTPLDLFERGDYAQIQDMIFYFESGLPL